jgi:transposase
MLRTKHPRRQAHSLRWQSPPWDDHHPDWLRIDHDLPLDHPARLIDRAVDQLDLQPYLQLFSAGFGSASWHPRLLLKLVLYEINRKVQSPAEWHDDCSEHLPLLWLLRGTRPSRATLYDCRRRFSPRFLKRLNRQVLLAAREQGHCPARRASIDGTFIAARGSRHHLLNLKRLDKRLALLELAVAADDAVATDLGGGTLSRPPRWMASSPQGRQRQLARYQQARLRLVAKMARHQQRQSSRAKVRRQPLERVVISPNEPDAAIGKDKAKVVRPLYDVQLVRDLDSPFLLGYGVFATNSDAGLLPEMLVRTKVLCGKLPAELLADSIYASVHDLRVCKRRQVSLYSPVVGERAAAKASQPAASASASAAVAGSELGRQPLPVVRPATEEAKGAKKCYGKERFVWEEATRNYVCPAGQRLHRLTQGRAARVHGGALEVEMYGTKACAGCAMRERCTRSKQGRRIKRLADEPLVEELRQRMAGAAGKELYRLRKQTIEREFADATEHRGLRRFNGMGQVLAETQVGLLVLVHNLKASLKQHQAVTKAAA